VDAIRVSGDAFGNHATVEVVGDNEVLLPVWTKAGQTLRVKV
jgi:hypothetical protein